MAEGWLSIRHPYFKYVPVVVLALVAFGLGTLTASPRKRPTLDELFGPVPPAKVFMDGFSAGYDNGHKVGFSEGWEGMRAKALEIMDRSAAMSVRLPPVPVVIQRSEDEEAVIQLQRRQLERQECERRYSQYTTLVGVCR